MNQLIELKKAGKENEITQNILDRSSYIVNLMISVYEEVDKSIGISLSHVFVVAMWIGIACIWLIPFWIMMGIAILVTAALILYKRKMNYIVYCLYDIIANGYAYSCIYLIRFVLSDIKETQNGIDRPLAPKKYYVSTINDNGKYKYHLCGPDNCCERNNDRVHTLARLCMCGTDLCTCAHNENFCHVYVDHNYVGFGELF